MFHSSEMCYKWSKNATVYTLNLENVLAVGGFPLSHPPPARSLRSLAQDLRQKGAPFEILSLQISKCSGAHVCERVFSYFLDRQFPKHSTQSVHQIAQFQFRKSKNSLVWEGLWDCGIGVVGGMWIENQ